MKHLKIYEEFKFNDKDFDEEEFKGELDLSGLPIDELVKKLNKLLLNNSDFLEFHFEKYIIQGDGFHFPDERIVPEMLGFELMDDIRDDILGISSDGDELIFEAVRIDWIDGDEKSDEGEGYDIDRNIYYTVNRSKPIIFVNNVPHDNLKVNISV